MLTVYEDTDHIYDALAAGATGYLLKETPRAELVNALQEVNCGGSPMTSNIARKVVQSFRQTQQSPFPQGRHFRRANRKSWICWRVATSIKRFQSASKSASQPSTPT